MRSEHANANAIPTTAGIYDYDDETSRGHITSSREPASPLPADRPARHTTRNDPSPCSVNRYNIASNQPTNTTPLALLLAPHYNPQQPLSRTAVAGEKEEAGRAGRPARRQRGAWTRQSSGRKAAAAGVKWEDGRAGAASAAREPGASPILSAAFLGCNDDQVLDYTGYCRKF